MFEALVSLLEQGVSVEEGLLKVLDRCEVESLDIG
jgi:hypothetical protein